jgi:hypothetical protein
MANSPRWRPRWAAERRASYELISLGNSPCSLHAEVACSLHGAVTCSLHGEVACSLHGSSRNMNCNMDGDCVAEASR